MFPASEILKGLFNLFYAEGSYGFLRHPKLLTKTPKEDLWVSKRCCLLRNVTLFPRHEQLCLLDLFTLTVVLLSFGKLYNFVPNPSFPQFPRTMYPNMSAKYSIQIPLHSLILIPLKSNCNISMTYVALWI